MSNTPNSSADAWMADWEPVKACVGREYPENAVLEYGPVVEASTIWRYLEPLEFDCPIHYDDSAAKQHGYRDVVLPSTAQGSFSLPPLWQPPAPLFASADRNAPLAGTALSGLVCGSEPPTEGFMVTELAAEYFLPVNVGDRLARKAARLVSCTPKETRIGRGAFLVWEYGIVNQAGDLVSVQRMTYYRYNVPVSGGPA